VIGMSNDGEPISHGQLDRGAVEARNDMISGADPPTADRG